MTSTAAAPTGPASGAPQGDTSAQGLITHHPALDETRARVTLPVVTVTLLEDRAQVRREGRVALAAGHNRLAVWSVAPVLQDVSLRVEVVRGSARVQDARVRRAVRVGLREAPVAVAELERSIESLVRERTEVLEDARRADERAAVLMDMMSKVLQEVPEDAAWGLGEPATWRKTFEALAEKARALQGARRDHGDRAEALAAEVQRLVRQRALLDSPDKRMECVVEVDVHAEAAGDVELAIEYAVPNALWRPFHIAELRGGTVRFSSQAAVWQNTGEDWTDCALLFSTARSSLGHEPPKLSDDKLAARKKDQRVVVEARQVAVSTAGLGRGGGTAPAAAPSGVQLPGVDDGGDILNLRGEGRFTVPSDGRPAFIPLFAFEAPAEASLVVMAEVEPKAFLRSLAVHTGRQPVLAGPVELVQSSGFVGTTRTLFVAPGERFQLGFGPDPDVRVQRTVSVEEEIDEVDKWKRRTFQTSIFLSNLSPDAKELIISERIPVSEIEHVTVTLVADKTSGAPEVNEHGVVTWRMSLPGGGRLRLQMVHVVALAPGVQGV